MSSRQAFIVMPFGKKAGPDKVQIDFDAIYEGLITPAVTAAGLSPFRADSERSGGSIHADMFQQLLLSEFVIADLTLDNANVWYEIGVRHALRGGGTVMIYALRERLPFDIAGQRMQRYSLLNGCLLPEEALRAEKQALTAAITATLGAWRGRRTSPIYQQLPFLQEPDWKALKVGAINEYWESLETWQSRIRIAKAKQRPGDILVLAEETPNSTLEFEALVTAAKALIQLKRPLYALNILDRARKIDPEDIVARQQEGLALGRLERYAEAREQLRELAKQYKDGETLGLYARTWKDEWKRAWEGHALCKQDPLTAARDTAATLRSAVVSYIAAFRAAPADYFPGINALTLGRLWEQITAEKLEEGQLSLDLIASGLAWCIDVAPDRDTNAWVLASRAELALNNAQKAEAIRDYSQAAALAVADSDRFALDSMHQQLEFLQKLSYRTDIVGEALQVLQRAERQLDARAGIGPSQAMPERVVVFSGHMIDDANVRGEGKPKPTRFPNSKSAAAALRIAAALDQLGTRAGDLGLCGGACGGDLLFAEECLKRGMKVELRLAKREAEFLQESVTFFDPQHRWEDAYMHVKDHALTLVMPEELGPTPDGVSAHDRCNRWILYSALSGGLRRAFFVTLWDGKEGDGPGGTKHMVELVRQLTGRQPEIIDPASL